jgi:hypothetical protein
VNDTVTDPLPEGLKVKVKLQLTSMVEVGVFHGVPVINISFEHECEETKPRGEKGVIHSGEPVRKHYLP